jgi:poly(3-hydroxybutyrate) depolymerase
MKPEARVVPEFLTKLLADFKVAGGKFQIAGTSNGGLSAFHIAAAYPQYFRSVTGFQQADQCRAQGYTVRFTVEKLQSHRLDTFAGEGAARLFNQFEEARQSCGVQ